MNTLGEGNCKGTEQGGFTLLELVVVIIIIGTLTTVALERYYRLMIDVERTSMEHDLGVMRSALGLQVAAHFVAGDMAGLERLTTSNPMDFLAEKPNNYLGVLRSYSFDDLEAGSWVYDGNSQTLIYLVRNHLYFESSLAEPARVRFKIFPVYSDRIAGDVKKKYISGLTLQHLEPYKWLSPWE